MRLQLVSLLATLSLALASQLPLVPGGLYGDSFDASAADPASTLSSGGAGPLRIELPYAAADALGGKQSIADQIAAQGGRHVVVTHQEFPEMSLRVRQVSRGAGAAQALAQDDPEAFCDPSVTSWSGYIDTIDGKSLFFIFFESRRDPDKDPLILWTNGGPGCSSAIGAYMELGPCRVRDDGGKGRTTPGPPINGTIWNPYGWNQRANLVFIDQPVDVGFSYSRFGVHTYDSDQGASDVYKFLRLFMGVFERFSQSEVVLSGESYGGRYIPRYAAEVMDQNRKLLLQAAKEDKEVDPKKIINLKRVLIGNGLTDVVKQTPAYYDFTCTTKGGVPSELLLGIKECKEMAYWSKRCETWLEDVCRTTADANLCAAAMETCEEALGGPYMATGRNPYDVSDPCKAGLEPNLCYPQTADIRAYLDRDDVRELLGAAPVSQIGKFASCNMKVAAGFNARRDSIVDNGAYIAALLERNIKVIIYVGTLDWICNWLGNLRWLMKLSWTGDKAFYKAKNYEWVVDGKAAGETQSGGGLTWATVFSSGHMVPFNRPREALEMLHRWLDDEKL